MEKRTPLRNSMLPSVQKKLDILVANSDIKYKNEYLEMLVNRENGDCGCKYCEDNEMLPNDSDIEVYIEYDGTNNYIMPCIANEPQIMANYCHMCGRKL